MADTDNGTRGTGPGDPSPSPSPNPDGRRPEEATMPGGGESGYGPAYPTSAAADPSVREFIARFYQVSDDPGRDDDWVGCFDARATVVIGNQVARGEREIRQLRKRMWRDVEARRHRLVKVFPGSFSAEAAAAHEAEYMLFGAVAYRMKGGGEGDAAAAAGWAAHAQLRRDSTTAPWRMLFYRVYLHGTVYQRQSERTQYFRSKGCGEARAAAALSPCQKWALGSSDRPLLVVLLWLPFMPGSKKDRKNGKEGGGVVAAVTKHGAKFSGNGNVAEGPSPNPSSPVVSPEMKPSSLSSNDNHGASPLLDAVSSTSYATSTSPSAREWARGGLGAGMAGSPGNFTSLAGESPPTAPSSYEDPRGIRSGWSSPRPAGGYYPSSVSPPTAGRRPLSFHMDSQYSHPDPIFQLATAAARRSSMHSHYAQLRAASNNPPLPHQPQSHFYGAAAAADLDLQPNKTGMKAGERGYYFGFDTLTPQQDADRVPGKDAVVLAGYEGGLEVFRVGKRGLESAGSLKRLRGGVYHAKVLPWTPESSALYPLVAMVVHGPVFPPPPAPERAADGGGYDAVSAERSEAMSNAGPDPAAAGNPGNRAAPGFVESYQTTVEVFSLKTGRLVAVLLEAPKIPLTSAVASPGFQAPPPTGAFHLHADGGNVVVSSGVTGECWIYRQAPATSEQPFHFRCHGKLWTTLQQPPRRGDAGQESERSRSPAPSRPRPQVAILSVSGRWIAYCPAAPSSQIALRALVPVPTSGRAPGLATVTPPQLPSANADLDLPLTESVVNKIMRDATQELIEGARWVGKQSRQAWNNYWNPQPSQPQQQPQQQRSPVLAPQSWGGTGADAPQFPPTHGTVVAQPVAKEPGLVSVLDLETLSSSANPHPVATFAIPHGCSFLSLSPAGLSLFSASSKGDVQSVWDLMRIQHTRSSPLQGAGSPPGGPRVRQVAQFSRMTVARIVDVAWTRPNGERLAMVTERGTVHLLDLPASAFTWPPPRRRRAQPARPAASEGPATSAVSIASTALNSVREVARPLISRHHRRSSSTAPATTGAGLGEYATHGGKVLAASISHSLGKTAGSRRAATTSSGGASSLLLMLRSGGSRDQPRSCRPVVAAASCE
ncbi:hypothetical protein VTH06DRAFT_3823 [Thermothelomyces fergusii]